MPNPYFQFKQFTIYHDKCAMKVGTDGVLLGAWANTNNPKHILDIGSGSGLISLMLAQRFATAYITGVEIEENGYQQSIENVSQSPFANRIKIHNHSIQEYANSRVNSISSTKSNAKSQDSRLMPFIGAPSSFDLIVSNPPFFHGAHTTGNINRDLARHSSGLLPQDLWKAVTLLSHENTVFCVILPILEGESFIQLANDFQWKLHQRINVKGQPNTKVKRLLLQFGQQEVPLRESSLIIEKQRGNYTSEFTKLVKAFYIKL